MESAKIQLTQHFNVMNQFISPQLSSSSASRSPGGDYIDRTTGSNQPPPKPPPGGAGVRVKASATELKMHGGEPYGRSTKKPEIPKGVEDVLFTGSHNPGPPPAPTPTPSIGLKMVIDTGRKNPGDSLTAGDPKRVKIEGRGVETQEPQKLILKSTGGLKKPAEALSAGGSKRVRTGRGNAPQNLSIASKGSKGVGNT